MVKATFECNGNTVMRTGDTVIGLVMETLEDGVGSHVVIMGKGSSKAVACTLAKCVPDILERVADDPLDVASSMMYASEMLEKQTKAYLAGHADEIAGAVHDYTKSLADK